MFYVAAWCTEECLRFASRLAVVPHLASLSQLFKPLEMPFFKLKKKKKSALYESYLPHKVAVNTESSTYTYSVQLFHSFIISSLLISPPSHSCLFPLPVLYLPPQVSGSLLKCFNSFGGKNQAWARKWVTTQQRKELVFLSLNAFLSNFRLIL